MSLNYNFSSFILTLFVFCVGVPGIISGIQNLVNNPEGFLQEIGDAVIIDVTKLHDDPVGSDGRRDDDGPGTTEPPTTQDSIGTTEQGQIISGENETEVENEDFVSTGSVTEDALITVPQEEVPKGKKTYPWLAAILLNEEHICSGSLIDHRHILTTAYCVNKLSPLDLTKVRIHIGFQHAIVSSVELDEDEGPFLISKVGKLIRHRNFNLKTAVNDVALIQTLVPITFDDSVHPIQLASNETFYEESLGSGYSLSILGWRKIQDLNGDPVSFWRDEPLESGLMSRGQCRKNYGGLLAPSGISDGMICAGGDKQSTSCYWYFGAPLVRGQEVNRKSRTHVTQPLLHPVQLGSFSWGIEALRPDCLFSPEAPSPMVFTKVSAYHHWINSNLGH